MKLEKNHRYLLEILDLKGFRAAAEQLHTTQPNLSAHPKQFRENSGLHLYRRSKSGRISLTPTGVAFKLIARGLLSARDEAMAALLAVEQGEVRTLRLGCSSQADPTLFNAFFAMHIAPPPLTLRMEAHDSLLYVFCQSGVKEILHRSGSPSLGG
jgi:DNA-binding transcriptional LysR family regulator